MRFSDKTVVVTGAGKGIGKTIAIAFAKEQANVVVVDVMEDLAKEVADIVKSMGRKSLGFKVDVRYSNDVIQMIEEAVHNFGGIDILVNNAGVHSMSPFIDLSEEDWDYNMDINAKGTFLCSKFAAKKMVKSGGGKIVNISSMAGKTGFPYVAHYCASKFAVIGLTKAMALDLAPYKINVNAVCPGMVETEMGERLIQRHASLEGINPDEIRKRYLAAIPLKRFEKPEDVAKVVLFLCSDQAEYMTGQAINVTGGQETH